MSLARRVRADRTDHEEHDEGLSEDEQDDSLEFEVLSDDASLSEGFSMDIERPESKSVSSGETGSGVLFEDLKLMVEQEEFEFEIEEEMPVVAKKVPEKKDLTPEERAKAEPVGQFFMNLTKANVVLG